MAFVKKLLSAIVVSLLVMAGAPAQASDFTVDFSFQLVTGERMNISDYSGTPVLIEWGASWCTICERNQEAMGEIYADYKGRVTFVSISFGGSGDDLSDVKSMKDRGNYSWDFGLDVDNYAAEVKVANGYAWLLDSDLKLLRTWNYTLVSAYELGQAFSDAFGYQNEVSSDKFLVPFPVLWSIMALTAVVLVRRRI